MLQDELAHWSPELVVLARRAGRAILDVWDAGVSVALKADSSPVTVADQLSEEILLAGLEAIAPGIPVISEERGVPDWQLRRNWTRLWLVDPLDGTREYAAGRDEFAVNISLVVAGSPVLGLIYQPTTDHVTMAYQLSGGGDDWVCFSQIGAASPIGLTKPAFKAEAADRLIVAVSHHYGDEDIQFLPQKLRQAFPQIEVVKVGSSLKFGMLAALQADFYVRNAPTYEWDTAAGQALLDAVGGGVCDFGGQPLSYNRRPSMLNPGFCAYGPRLSMMEWL